ncbi:MAG: ABC transporter substrate-binding protein [Oligoflexia bacterium]|nr:ABC transporter substrate-binding protein [Oligoflexia bacterium]
MLWAFCLLGLSVPALATEPIRILLDQTPATLNPRGTLDAAGQRINALIFRGLTRIDSDLQPQPDLAESWSVQNSGRVWKFRIRPELRDHAGRTIDARQIAACLENYRTGKPVSPLRGSFPHWKGTESDSFQVTIRLEKPDPYLPRNISLLRYFIVSGAERPCAEPAPDAEVIGSGLYRPEHWDLSPESHFLLQPTALASGRRPVDFLFIHDDNTKALKLIRGEIDAIQNSISLTKTRWLQQDYADRFRSLEREGVSVSYLAYNMNDPLLRRRELRRAIALALDRESIVRHKHLGFTSLAGSLLSPLLPESHQVPFAYDPRAAEALLEQAGFPRGKDGFRLELRYKSTPVREGIETALLFQEMLAKVGIRLRVDVVEPAVFLASVRRGHFQLYSSRWLGVADGSILYNTLHSGQAQNRVAYGNPEMDRLLEQAIAEPEASRRIPLLRRVQELAGEELPYLPLWYWGNALILRKGLVGIEARDLSLSGGLEPLTRLR